MAPVEPELTYIVRPQMRLLPCWKGNPFRSLAVRCVCVLSAWVLVIVVGVVVYRNSLNNKRKEFQLKCDNRKEVFTSEVDNNLGASFVILGLLASVSNVTQDLWIAFTNQTVFLRPHVTSLVYCLRVLADQRAAVEKKYNQTFYTFGSNGQRIPRGYDTEYTPVLYQSANISSYMVDISAFPIFKSACNQARDTGDTVLSAPYLQNNAWRMGSFLPYYGAYSTSDLTTVEARRASCQGYVVTVLDVQEVFASVSSSFKDNLVVNAIDYVDSSLQLNTYYNCSTTQNPCEVVFFRSDTVKANKANSVDVAFTYGTQNLKLQCTSPGNVQLQVLRGVVAWPLLMAAIVVFCTVAVYLVLKRMSTVEKDVSVMEIMNENLKIAKSNAEAADTAKSSFLATVSHEIRTPMNGVIGMTNLLMGTDLTPQQLEYVKIAQASGNALVALISDVLDLSKIEAGKMEIETVPFDMREEVDSILSLFEEKVQQKKLEVSALVHDSVPIWLYGDPGRFRQILINLVGNAIKFTKEGSIFLCIRLAEPSCSDSYAPVSGRSVVEVVDAGENPVVEIPLYPVTIDVEAESRDSQSAAINGGQFVDSAYSTSSDKMRWQSRQVAPPRLSMKPGPLSSKACVTKWRQWKPLGGFNDEEVTIIVSVEDTGIGIPVHMQSQLFEPFVQADSTTSREYGGTGIGLSICQKLVRLSKGDITVDSEPGEGSVFKFSIVLPTSGPCGHLEKLSISMKRQPSDLEEERIRGLRVLLVDANPVRQEVAATYLRRVGAVIEYAENVSWAVELLLRKENPTFQAVIVDLQGLDHNSALQLVQCMRDENIEKVPVLALSIPPDSEVQKELHEAGFLYMVHKPLRCTTLIAGLLQALGVQVANPSRRANANAKMLAGKRILVVDDNMVNRRVASSMLQRYGATVVAVNGGVEAFHAVKYQDPEKQIDLILMDIQMPEMDGYAATRCIRRWEVDDCEQCRAFETIKVIDEDEKVCPHQRVPIVAVTADVMKGTHELCFSAGMDDYIPKPLDQKQLQLLLERFLKGKLVNAPGSP